MPRRARNSTSSRPPSGIIGNVMTYEHGGKQYVAVLSGGRWLGRHRPGGRAVAAENAAAWHGAVDQGQAAEARKRPSIPAGLGAVGGYAGLASYTSLGGTLTVFALPSE